MKNSPFSNQAYKESTSCYKPFSEIFFKSLSFLLLIVYLVCGIFIFRDYGASSDEYNQIEAGHITWAAICEKLGKETPEFRNLPKLTDYYNRYYGQAATFPTVIIEAIKGFSLDRSTVLRLRHAWNFFVYFCGLICFGVLAKLNFQRSDVVFFLLLLHILTPKLFGDAFYNDRDILLIALLWLSLLCFRIFYYKPGFFTAVLCSFFFALAINTRFFALILFILPIIILFNPDFTKKRQVIVLIIMTIFFWYAITPLFWGNFINEFSSAFATFSSGKQRTQESNGMAEILFFGKHIRETDLPFYYLPLWIFISTPLIPQLICVYGLFKSFRRKKDFIDQFMMALLCLGIGAVMLIRPVMYNGWRHMYFFYVPIFWFIGIGLKNLFSTGQRKIVVLTALLILLSTTLTTIQVLRLHPYEYLYLNPLFRSRTADFDRDYWRLSTTECLHWISSKEKEGTSLGELNANIDNTLIFLLPETRNRINVHHYNALHRYPYDYLIFNYSGETKNTAAFPLFEPVYAVQREGAKLAEIFKHLPSQKTDIIYTNQQEPVDNDLNTEWRSERPQNSEDSLIIRFAAPAILSGLSLAPGEDEQEYPRSPEVSISTDGETWTPLPLTISGLFDLSFPTVTTEWLRIRNTEPADFHWSIREIYFYQ